MNKKIRLDLLLTELGYFESREQARRAIMAHKVRISSQLATKAGEQIDREKFIEAIESKPRYLEIEQEDCPFVSRGALKLEAAIRDFNLDFQGAVVLDIGASTGGFSDCSLRYGAKQVLALDVGKGQLHYKLRDHKQILNIEETNFRYADEDQIAREFEAKFQENLSIDFVLADLSFISIIKILPKLSECLNKYAKPETKMIFLIKPQFEAGKKEIDKCQGVIKDADVRERILAETLLKIQSEGYQLLAQSQSPISGAKGNIEYLALFKKKASV